MRRTGWTVLAVLGLTIGTATPASADQPWTEERLPPRDTYAELATAASGDGATWAFGGWYDAHPIYHSLAYRRGAQGWEEVPMPDISRVQDSVVVAGDDVWAIGEDIKYGHGKSAHWDGAEWTVHPFAPPPDHGHQLGEITAFAPDDVWTVGDTWSGNGDDARGMTQHWDGHAWQDVAVPEVAGRWTLHDVGGAAPDDVWAVGETIDQRPGRAVALHWDGGKWDEVPMPDLGGTDEQTLEIDQVEALGPDEVWATGVLRPYGDAEVEPVPIMLRWDGQRWTSVQPPQNCHTRGELLRVGDELWSLGDRLLHHDGEQWQEVTGPTTGIPAGGAELDGRLLTVGSAGRYPTQQNPFVSVHNS